MPEKEQITANDFTKQAASYEYVQKNILKVKPVEYPQYDIRFIENNEHGRIIGMVEYEGKFYVSIFNPSTFIVYVNIVTHMEGGRIMETDAIPDSTIADLIIAKFDETNTFSNLSLITNAIDSIIDEYCVAHQMNEDEKKLFRNESISYAVLREAIDLARQDLISVDDLKSVIFSSKNVDEKVYMLQLLIGSRKVAITADSTT